ncbi:MAG: pentapeptide repeat-containing protein [Phycisphaerae bacterium]|nr:pentapeptide repeat-containing protein [Phycisphaerae bacterium]
MANPEHLAILKKGVDAWNKWRRHHPEIQPDSTNPDASEMESYSPNLSGSNLSFVKLPGVDLSGTDLSDAYLTLAGLSHANLFDSKLSGANLIFADLSGATLIHADLSGANLSDAGLSGVNLFDANLSHADLSGACLRGANLSNVDLSTVNLCRADLSNANLSGVNLSGVDLYDVNLSGANLQFSQLIRCNLARAKLTGAKLYGTARDDWIINGVECGYVFWDAEGEIRSPRDRDLAPGEFEQLYQTLPTIEYIFQNGMSPMDPLIMDRVVQAIRRQNPEFDIQIDSINARGLVPSIKFTVQQEEHKEPALAEVTRIYEAKLQEFAGRLDEARAFIQLLIDRPNPVYIENATAQYLAVGGSTINIDQHVENITNLRDAVAALPEDSPTFAKIAKNTAMDLIGSALKDVAKGQIKAAARQIYELGKDLGPVIVKIVNTAAYASFKSMMPGG